MASPNTVELTDDNFDTEIVQHKGLSLVDFWAPWCGPCRMVAPAVEAIAAEYTGKLKVGKVNTDEAPEVSAKFGIRSIPTIMLFRDGEIVDQIIGALPKDQIAKKVEQALA